MSTDISRRAGASAGGRRVQSRAPSALARGRPSGGHDEERHADDRADRGDEEREDEQQVDEAAGESDDEAADPSEQEEDDRKSVAARTISRLCARESVRLLLSGVRGERGGERGKSRAV